MDTTTFDQIHMSSEALGESVNYLKAEMTIQFEFYGTEPVGIELPQTVDLKVVDTAPGIKGATASAQIKAIDLSRCLAPFISFSHQNQRRTPASRLNPPASSPSARRKPRVSPNARSYSTPT